MAFIIFGFITMFLAAGGAIWWIVRQPPKNPTPRRSPPRETLSQELSEIEGRIMREIRAGRSTWQTTTITSIPAPSSRTPAPAPPTDPEPSGETEEKDSTIFDFLLEDERNNQP